MIRRLLAAAGLATLVAAVPLRAQSRGVRFEISAVGDTTVDFRVGAERWVRPGERGVAVDPRRRDVLVARLRIQGVDPKGVATALITGQTTAITTDHVVLLREPRAQWYRGRAFWGGLAAGLALGVVAGAQF